MSRSFDIVIYGATGYTAGLTIDYLLSNKIGTEYKWAIAGRNKSKLEALLVEKKKSVPLALVDPTTVPIIVASVDDETSLDILCKQTTVLLAMAGPYIRCGLPIVAACVRNATHYLDTTGEFQYVRLVIERYHSEATAKKVVVVPACGFYSVPSDIGSNMMHEFVSKLSGSPKITDTVGYFNLKKATISGGAANSFSLIFDTIKPVDYSPVSLNPSEAHKGIRTPSQRFVGYVGGFLKLFTAPFAMAGSDERVVRRSNALLGRSKSSYFEAAATKSLFGAIGGMASFYVLKALLFFKPIRQLVTKNVLPPQGSGPSAADKQEGGFTVTFVSTATNGTQYKGVWQDERDAYDLTAIYIVQSAATLLDTLKSQDVPIVGGVLTPASAFGMKFLNRLLENDAGTKVHVEEISKAK